jgi:hypothetical protein
MHQTFPAREILFSTFTMSEPDRSGQCWNAYATLCTIFAVPETFHA